MIKITQKDADLIVKNITSVIKSRNIEKLNKRGYNFLYLCQGFIAHYNIRGFKGAYKNVEDLIDNLLRNKNFNQWENFRVGEKDAEYYHSKRDIYNIILQVIK
jgi:hypothetical protein